MSSSEAVMVSPEQCATAPKTALSKELAPTEAQSSSTRLVFLAVLALAAATGAMFGVVVFGNEFTKDVHPKGSSNMNSVTLVDVNDRAIATADVESYVSLLDLPLLGTAELNKVDGITFSTFKGIEHHKVTGYSFTRETATVGDSTVDTPRLSLRSAPGVTIEISVRDSKAWVREEDGHLKIDTAIETTSTRRLSSGGSCLANGACLYSRDELLSLDAETRRLSEGSFFARADVAAYQVELGGDVLPYLPASDDVVSLLSGYYMADGHRMSVKISKSAYNTNFLLVNGTSGDSKLMSRNGTFEFDKYSNIVGCNIPRKSTDMFLSSMDLKSVADDAEISFVKVNIAYSATEDDFIPHSGLTESTCVDFATRKSNMTSPEYIWGQVDVDGNTRKLIAQQHVSRKARHAQNRREAANLMFGDNEWNRELKRRS
ncbi:hypothetical protein JL721_4860 [Aureococcus anophagefferens]|nr:hypothetical protein JL721_4860 [Aureococcus anophagefferens]